MMTPSLSTMIGALNPNSRMLFATASTEASFLLGFLSYGRMSPTFTSLISAMSCFLPFFFNVIRVISC